MTSFKKQLGGFVVLALALALVLAWPFRMRQPTIHTFCTPSNDLYNVLAGIDGIHLEHYSTINDLLSAVSRGDAVLVLADGYPDETVSLPESFFGLLEEKGVRFYVEYISRYPGLKLERSRINPQYERAIISSSFFAAQPDSLAILGINGLTYVPTKASEVHIAAGRVAGFDHAVYGLPQEMHPLLFELPDHQGLFASTNLSRFVTGRYAPQQAWLGVWKRILRYLVPGIQSDQLQWDPAIRARYGKTESMPHDFQMRGIESGLEWYSSARMLIPDGYETVICQSFDKKINTGSIPWNDTIPLGNGSNGVFECIFSNIDAQGCQPIGVSRRGDCTAESAMAFALSGEVQQKDSLRAIAKNLLHYYLAKSPALKGEYGDPRHAAYGLIPWGIQNYAWYRASYGDDNARFLLSALVTRAITGDKTWDELLMKNLVALARTTGANGFRGNRIDLPDLEKNGWQHYYNREIINMAPHFEAYLWACFLWAYRETGDPLFLDRTEQAIRMTMEHYADGWKWTNGLAQEKARILLPLSWLVRVRNTEENRRMLQRAVDGLLELQEPCGAIREELGNLEKGKYPPTRSNEEYGLHEASLIAKNGDPVSDLLYTTNFAFLGLHEAYYTTKDPHIRQAADKLAEFLCRIQVKSKDHPELHGGWMRAFDYERFEHWGSNSDAGWGAWAIESGWTQGWILSVLSLRELDTSLWDLTENSGLGNHYPSLKAALIPNDMIRK